MYSRTNFALDLDDGNAELPSLVELIQFLRLYLQRKTTETVEELAKQLVLKPDEDTKGFVKFVQSAIKEKIEDNREKMKKFIEDIFSDYLNHMQNSERHNTSRESCSVHSFDSERDDAGKKLIENLEAVIPEPKVSNFKYRTLQVARGGAQDYVKELREDLHDYIDDRNRMTQERLRLLLDNFKNDLHTLSKQLRMISKIDIFVKRLIKEHISEETKESIIEIVEPMKHNLRKAKLTRAMAENISELTRRANILAGGRVSKSFKSAVKEMGKTADYLFGVYL
ncbi:uncharacterized protein PF3D7_1120000 isoform X2 [Halyomorpha halys]|uniref:uncharacterized protein PF3D7_1120000 isoform X2 n=1 Tax=Halyomorpha halys TaxID=286706 RepID=UPI0006D51A9C|nr:uncharacterized protein LOC106677136 isoform X2 [Halyomorpha halys]